MWGRHIVFPVQTSYVFGNRILPTIDKLHQLTPNWNTWAGEYISFLKHQHAWNLSTKNVTTHRTYTFSKLKIWHEIFGCNFFGHRSALQSNFISLSLLLKYILTLCVNTNLWRICDIVKHFLKIKKTLKCMKTTDLIIQWTVIEKEFHNQWSALRKSEVKNLNFGLTKLKLMRERYVD